MAWHIDPFGHSKEQANLFEQMGFDGFLFARIDYGDKIQRLRDKSLEMMWKPRPESKGIFTAALYGPLYMPPKVLKDFVSLLMTSTPILGGALAAGFFLTLAAEKLKLQDKTQAK